MDCLQSSSATLQLQARSRQKPNSYDFISQMSDDVLIKILLLMSIKDAVATSGLATRWRFLWRNLRQLNFDGGNLQESEREKYIDQVNSVIRSYNHPTVKDFRIRHGLKCSQKEVIDNWLKFAVEMKVEYLELDLTDNSRNMCLSPNKYNFPSRLDIRRIPISVPRVVVVLAYLKKLKLKSVNVTKEIFQEFLKNSPHLEMISMHYPQYLYHIEVGGQSLNLKHFELRDNCDVRSIYLSDLDLVSFTYKGSQIDLRLAQLPKLKELELHMGRLNINDVFGQISSCALSLQSLSMAICDPQDWLILDSVPELLNLKKLRLTIDGRKNDCLLYLASIMNACPNLETFSIKPFWTSPMINRKKARDATNPQEHLKLVEIAEYKGRKCDFELAAYIIDVAVALKKIVIATPDFSKNVIAIPDFYKKKETAQSRAKRVESIKPQDVELVIL